MRSIIVKNAIFEKKKLMLSIAALLAVMGLIFALRTLSAQGGRERQEAAAAAKYKEALALMDGGTDGTKRAHAHSLPAGGDGTVP